MEMRRSEMRGRYVVHVPDEPTLPLFAPGVLGAIGEHVDSDPRTEVGGILVARMIDGRRIIVDHIEAHAADGDVTSLTFTHEAWADIHAEMERKHAGAEISGWYHSHPGHGVFLSGHDRFVHEHFFPATWHVALVIDPQHRTDGLFAWRDGALVQVAGEHDAVADHFELAEPVSAPRVAQPRTVIEVSSVQTAEWGTTTTERDALPATSEADDDDEMTVPPALMGLVLPAAAGLLVGLLGVAIGVL